MPKTGSDKAGFVKKKDEISIEKKKKKHFDLIRYKYFIASILLLIQKALALKFLVKEYFQLLSNILKKHLRQSRYIGIGTFFDRIVLAN